MDLNEAKARLDQFCASVSGDFTEYDILQTVGTGGFGEVFKAKHKKNGQIVAMKKLIPPSKRAAQFLLLSVREIGIMRNLKNNANVISFYEVCKSQGDIYIVMEFGDHDLFGLIVNPSILFQQEDIKNILQQLLVGLSYIHSHKILHRDLKPANIVVTNNGNVKLADFGLARYYTVPTQINPRNCFSVGIASRWYKSPEILLRFRNYSFPVDMWSIGCIMVEMWTRTPLMQGTSDEHQIRMISYLCGSITVESWPELKNCELYEIVKLPQGNVRKVKEVLYPYILDYHALDLVHQILTLDPDRRIEAETALTHPYFIINPQRSNNLSRLLANLPPGQHFLRHFEVSRPGHVLRTLNIFPPI